MLILSPTLKIKMFTPKKILIFQKMDFLALRLKKFSYFKIWNFKKSLIFLITFYVSWRNFPCSKNKKYPLWKNFLYFGKRNFLGSNLKNFFYFWSNLEKLEKQTKKSFLKKWLDFFMRILQFFWIWLFWI